jgi:hypothetical protein
LAVYSGQLAGVAAKSLLYVHSKNQWAVHSGQLAGVAAKSLLVFLSKKISANPLIREYPCPKKSVGSPQWAVSRSGCEKPVACAFKKSVGSPQWAVSRVRCEKPVGFSFKKNQRQSAHP